jgi:hypothetical protein
MQEGRISYDISYRGGTCGVDSETLCKVLFSDKGYEKAIDISAELPGKTGVYCNYLGGGLRGSLLSSPFDRVSLKYARERIEGFIQACRDFYDLCEMENGLQDEEYPDGETNWDNMATNAARAAGVVSAY